MENKETPKPNKINKDDLHKKLVKAVKAGDFKASARIRNQLSKI